jgi:cysteine desulfurase
LISNQISGAQLVGSSSNCDPRNLAIVISGVISEELLRRLDQRGIKVDAGSACGAGALSPSHVLEAMGYGLDGQIRITLKPGHNKNGVEQLVAALAEEVLQLRN